VSFEIGYECGVGVDIFKMRREGVPNRGASMPKTTRGESNLDTRLGEKIGGAVEADVLGCSKDDKYGGHALWRER